MSFTEIKNERFGEKYYTMRHSSGLPIMVCPKEGFESAYAVIGTRFGSINSEFVRDGKTVRVPDGTAHYLEHKLFESEEGDAFSLYAKTGASANAYTAFDVTCYLFLCTDQFEESLRILFDLIQSPYFTPETVAKEQGIIGQEIKMYEDDPDWRVLMNLLQAMYRNHPINIDIAGTVESIAEITPEILYECYNSYYNLNNMVLCIAGDVDPDTVLKIADEKLKKNDPVKVESVFPEEPYEVKETRVEQSLPVAVPMFSLGFKEKAPARYAATKELLCTNIILEAFAGTGSALYRKLMDQELINSTFGTQYMEGNGYRAVVFEGETKSPDEAAAIIREEIRTLHQNGISPEDFENARAAAYGKIAFGFDSTYSIASEMINAAFTGRGVYEAADLIGTLTLDDINSRLAEQLDPDNCCLSVIRPIG